VLSVYAVYVEHKTEHLEEGEEFTSLCDIETEAFSASCSAVFALPQGRMLSYFGLIPEKHALDLPNAALGVLYYAALLSGLLFEPILSLAVATAWASTVFLAYELTFVVPELCVLCWSTHVINTTLFYKHFFGERKAKEKQF
jgi:uncharacterized membrane protein